MLASYTTPNRLNDLIAAIPVLAINDSYKRTAKGWARVITGIDDNSEYWRKIFEEHSEFFRKTQADKDDGNEDEAQRSSKEKEQANIDKAEPEYSLVMRRGVSSRYHKVWKKVVQPKEYLTLSQEERNKLTRAPLSDSQTKMLIDLAVTLHDQALVAKNDWRWWVTPLLSLLGSFGGALIAHWLPKFLS